MNKFQMLCDQYNLLKEKLECDDDFTNDLV